MDVAGWGVLLSLLKAVARLHAGPSCSMPEEAFCNDTGDVRLAAAVTLRCLGRMHAGPKAAELSDSRAEEAGARIMKKSVAEYGDWLIDLMSSSDRSVVFALLPDNNKGFDRVGACVVIPIAEEKFTDICQGLVTPFSLKKTDVLTQSEYLNINALADRKQGVSRGQLRRNAALAHACLYLLAMSSMPLRHARHDVHIVAIPGGDMNEQRLRSRASGRYGVKDAHGLKVYQLSPERRPTGRMWYGTFSGLIAAYQDVYGADFRPMSRPHYRRRDDPGRPPA